MPNKYRYVPLLKSKAGEAMALENLVASVKSRLLPLIRLSEKPPVTFPTRVLATWAGLPMALDGLFNYGTTGSLSNFTSMFGALGRGKVHVMPAIEYDAPAPYVGAVQKAVGRYAPGLAVQATIGQLAQASGWVATQGWQPTDIDLIIVAGHVSAYGNAASFADYVVHALRNSIPQPSPWRSVTLAAAAAPKDYSTFVRGRATVPRLDWQLWQHISGQMSFRLDYGDYGVAHPDLAEPPGVAMIGASVSVRYTTDKDWVIFKGTRTTGASGQAMATQFHAHAKALIKEPKFGGLKGCWGDQRIQQIAGGSPKSGNRTTWVAIGANRHLSLVADQLP